MRADDSLKPYFERFIMQKKLVFKIFLLLCVLMSSEEIMSRNAKKNPARKDSYNVKVFGDVQLQQIGLEEFFRNYPAVCTAGAATVFLSYIYSEEIKNFIQSNKHACAGVGLSALSLLYYNKDTIINWLPQDEEEEEDSFYSFSRSGVRVFKPGDISTRFKDVAGLETAKEDLFDIVSFLKDSTMFVEIGARIPKGVLLSGAPGNGKTLLARALAGEVRCPFLYINASEFIEAVVGMGAARIRHLFEVAKALAPCIVFIDEIDAIGRKRSFHGGGGDTELAQTLNQLLAEMDGFEQQKNPIVIIGATNRADVLDRALTRPGRFDRKVEIGLPYKKDRMKVLQVHFKKVKSRGIDIEKIAQGTTGFSSAQLAQLVNEAAILAIRDDSKFVTMDHVDQARDFIILGRETKGMEVSELDLWHTAVHESGHALAQVYQQHAIPLYKVTIVPRGGALGVAHGMMIKERYSHFEHEMRAEIVVLLAGSVAEECIYKGRGAGASNDLEKARSLATEMVMRFGMTDEFKDVTFAEFIGQQDHLPGEIATKLHHEVAKVIQECRAIAHQIITDHQDKLMQLVGLLMEEGTVFGSDVYDLCGLEQPSVVYSLAE